MFHGQDNQYQHQQHQDPNYNQYQYQHQHQYQYQYQYQQQPTWDQSNNSNSNGGYYPPYQHQPTWQEPGQQPPPIQTSSPYQPPVLSREQPPPPAYDPAQRPMSWPSSPQDYQNYYTAPFPAVSGSSSLQPPAPAQPPNWLGHHSHSHHHSISGPLGLPNIPSTGTRPNNDLALEDAQRIRDAFGVGGLHHTPVINIIANRSPEHLENVLISYKNLTGHDLLATLKDTSRSNKLNKLIDTNSKHFNTAAIAILLGPVSSEGYWVVKSVKGSGTNEALLTEAIFGRTNPELESMKSYIRSSHFKHMEDYVRSDLSMGTKTLFEMGMEPSLSKDPNHLYAPPDRSKVRLDVQRIITSTPTLNLFSKNSTVLCQVLALNTPGYIIAVADEYRLETGKNLRDLITRAFFGHMKDTLLYILDGVVDKVERDAKLLEDAMVGAGTRNHLLISRLIRIHWNKPHLAEVKQRYSRMYKQDLVSRLRKEVKGSYRDLMISIAESDVSPWRQ
ncbi:hypothetical protein TWF225_010646 [Orbilia oligospora]|uniref:Uncharacterized protein n=1 Tax=Orbilia oligospora TaxID=2813651 RepID=A0A7C8JZD8_ORBOL|nr:hypothetical protein TWF751_000753 [Orbilia oligospora]KAF3171177.1 hypothetical protein TWF225_010646 [Orbilia oligospora]KAF3237342.1 hypothetical protein TWF128_000951 [Orbilia oligospora]KAF3237343.1 hypothetical protein TWF128_000951 [Orbilia oligospora]KAF3237344.1 hypothetical protein TWF128_000951 [Orbilia oligospora]